MHVVVDFSLILTVLLDVIAMGRYDAFHYFRDHGEDVPLGIAGVLDFVEARVTFEPNTQVGRTPC